MTPKYIIGIDEVGRGPLAGPVAIGAICTTSTVLAEFGAIKESKQLTEKKRELWNAKIVARYGDDLRGVVTYVTAAEIDVLGIAAAIRKALAAALVELAVDPLDCRILLDGGLYAPTEYPLQETIIGGDAKETVIAMASVIAKVARDHHMLLLDKQYPEYSLGKHKGYGTKAHMDAIRVHGLSPEHRRSFCKNLNSQ